MGKSNEHSRESQKEIEHRLSTKLEITKDSREFSDSNTEDSSPDEVSKNDAEEASSDCADVANQTKRTSSCQEAARHPVKRIFPITTSKAQREIMLKSALTPQVRSARSRYGKRIG